MLMADLSNTPTIKKCPPGSAEGSHLYHWQFGMGINDPIGPADMGTARRLAIEDLKPWEALILEMILNQPSDLSQRDLETFLVTQIKTNKSQVYMAVQRLAKQGKISRQKVSGQWRYARPGFSWRSARP